MTRRPQVTLPVAQPAVCRWASLLGPRGSDRLLVELAVAFAQKKNEQ